MKLQLEGPTKKKRSSKPSVFKRKFSLLFVSPSQGPIRDPSLRLGGWTGVFTRPDASVGSSILSLPAVDFFFFVLTLRAMSQKKRQKAALSFFWWGCFFKIAMFQGTQQWKKLCQLVML